jgi:5'-deoxynucleotidase YfbR-like HD superfamily hydrolase
MATDEFGFDPKVINVLQKKESFINEAEQKFFNSLSAVEQAVFKAVWSEAQKMNQDSGNLLFDEENIDSVNKIQKLIAEELKKSSYPKDVKTYLRSFEDIKRFNLQANESVNDNVCSPSNDGLQN